MSDVVSIAIINVGVLWFLSLLAIHTDDENHAPLKLFFILSSVWMSVNLVHLSTKIGIIAGLDASIISALDTNFYLVIIAAIVTSLYFTLYYIKSVLEAINKLVFRRRNKING